ncbi:MAG TPA: heme-binding protein, partial [Planctomycetota bacterium]|nr:heme-binding protein [Planctomycetota bacterium]
VGDATDGNGITIFPGGIPLYKSGILVGGIGVSGDGVDQDDYVAAAGAAGFEPPDAIRCDNFFIRGTRLPYVKFPRNPTGGVP